MGEVGRLRPLNLRVCNSGRACLGARDPYCGWDRKQQRCSTLEDSSNMSLWIQNITACPVRASLSLPSSGLPLVSLSALGLHAFPTLHVPGSHLYLLQVRNVTRDGGFGPWSSWQPCEHLDGDNSGSCLCRARACDSPQPRCGGQDCLGPAIHIANCSRYEGTQAFMVA